MDGDGEYRVGPKGLLTELPFVATASSHARWGAIAYLPMEENNPTS